MCGIFAVYSKAGHLRSDDLEKSRRALENQIHRGPDDSGEFVNDRIFLGHRRLSIMDLSSAGHQPMSSEDGQVQLVFNGQIYNWRELREELAGKGYSFSSHCDTECILYAYLEWGEEFCQHLIGMWAVVIWDGRSQKLLVSRDRLGIKPLYMYEDGETLIFSSEIKSILTFLPQRPALNEYVLKRYMTRGWLDDIEETFYQNIFNFPSRSLSVWTGSVRYQRDFWHLPIPHRTCSDVGQWKDLFTKIVDDHIQSDANLATTLSGGLDSTAINSVIARELGKAHEINAFSVLAADIPDESPLIDHTVKELGIKHQYIDIGEINYVEEIDELLQFHDEPTYSAGQVNQFVFRKKIKELGYKVLLVGDGADEILAGYAKIVPMYIASLLRDGKTELAHQALEGSSVLSGRTPEDQLKRIQLLEKNGIGGRTVQEFRFAYQLFNEDHVPDDHVMSFLKVHPNIRSISSGRLLYQELMDRMTIDIPQVFRNEDRNGMASSLEVRPIFMDHRLLEKTWTYPYEMMMQEGRNKDIMRSALKGIMPKAILDNLKKFVRPGSVNHLVYHCLDKPLEEILQSPSVKESDLWQSDLLQRYRQSKLNNDGNHALVWMRFYMLQRLIEMRFK